MHSATGIRIKYATTGLQTAVLLAIALALVIAQHVRRGMVFLVHVRVHRHRRLRRCRLHRRLRRHRPVVQYVPTFVSMPITRTAIPVLLLGVQTAVLVYIVAAIHVPERIVHTRQLMRAWRVLWSYVELLHPSKSRRRPLPNCPKHSLNTLRCCVPSATATRSNVYKRHDVAMNSSAVRIFGRVKRASRVYKSRRRRRRRHHKHAW